MEMTRSPRRSYWFLLRISLFWLGLSTVWGGLNVVYLPDRVETLVGTANKGTFLGVLVALGLIVAVIVQPVMGALSDRSSLRWGRRRPFMAAGALFTGLLLLMMAAVGTYALLLTAAVLMQISSNTAQGAYQGVIPDLTPESQRGGASSLYGIMNMAGQVLGALAAGLLLDAGNPQAFLLAAAGMLTLTAVIAAIATPEEAPVRTSRRTGLQTEAARRWRELRGSPAFRWFLLSRTLFFMGLLASDNILLFTLRERLRVDEPGATATVVLGTMIVFAILVSLPAGWLADRYGRRSLVYVGCGVAAVGAAIMVAAVQLPVLLAGVAVMGMGLGAFVAADWAMAMDLLPDKNATGFYMGMTNLAPAGGDALASLMAGVVLDTFNRVQPLLGYGVVYAMMAILFVLAGLVLTRVRVPRAEAGAIS